MPLGPPEVLRPRGASSGRRSVARRSVSQKALTQFTTQLSTLQDAGLPIVRSLKILEGQMERGPFKYVLADVTEDVESGSPLSEALAKHPSVFDHLYSNMVKAGEAGGVLDVILSRLAGFMEKAQRLRRRVKGAMIYPTVVFTVVLAILLLIMIFVVPKFEEVFKQLPGGGELPWLTQQLQRFSKFLVQYWWVFIFGMIVALDARSSSSREASSAASSSTGEAPHPGRRPDRPARHRRAVRRTFGTLISSGVPILEALDICRDTAGNFVMENALGRVRDSISRGGNHRRAARRERDLRRHRGEHDRRRRGDR